MEYYTTIKRNGILKHGFDNMDDCENVMLSEISQRKTNILCFHLYAESKKQNK